MSDNALGPAPPMQTSGTCARCALATAVTTSVTPGPAVTAQTPAGAKRVGGQDAKPVGDIASTLDVGMQRAAEDALAPLTTPAAIVAIQPSTGNLLEVYEEGPQNPFAVLGGLGG